MNEEIKQAIHKALYNKVRERESTLIKNIQKEHGWDAAAIKIEINKGIDDEWLGKDEHGPFIRIKSSADQKFAPKKEKIKIFLKKYWPELASNIIAVIALLIALFR